MMANTVTRALQYAHVATLSNPRTIRFSEAQGAFDWRVCEKASVLHKRPVHGFIWRTKEVRAGCDDWHATITRQGGVWDESIIAA